MNMLRGGSSPSIRIHTQQARSANYASIAKSVCFQSLFFQEECFEQLDALKRRFSKCFLQAEKVASVP